MASPIPVTITRSGTDYDAEIYGIEIDFIGNTLKVRFQYEDPILGTTIDRWKEFSAAELVTAFNTITSSEKPTTLNLLRTILGDLCAQALEDKYED